MKYVIPVLLVAVFLLPGVSEAQGGLVQCSGPDCTFCSFVQMVNGIVKWLVGVLSTLAVLALVVAGFRLVTSAGNPEAMTKAKSMFSNVIIGFIIVLAAWLIVDTVLKAVISKDFNDGGFGPWNEIKNCGQGSVSGGSGVTTTSGSTGTDVFGATNPTGNLTSYAGAQFDSGVVDKMKYLDENFDLRVSGGHRTPERNAAVGGVANSNHLTGRAGDFVGSSAAMQSGAAWARANGAKEVLVHDAGSGNHLHVAW